MCLFLLRPDISPQSKDRQQSQWQPLLLLLGVPYEYQLHICYIYVEGLGPSHSPSLVGGAVSVCTYKTRLLDSVSFVVSLNSLAPTSIFLLFHVILHPLMNVCLWDSASVSISFWVNFLRGQLWQAPCLQV